MNEILLFDYFDEYGYYNVIGQGDLSASVLVPKIDSFAGSPLLIRISTAGGGCDAGLAIYNAVKRHGDVTVRIEGMCASMGTGIAMGAKTIEAYKASIWMFHKPMVDAFWLGTMNTDDLERELKALKVWEDILNGMYVDKTGLSKETIDEIMSVETWMSSQEAFDLGFVDKIVEGESQAVSDYAFNHISKRVPLRMVALATKNLKIENMSNHTEQLQTLNENTSKLTNVLNEVRAFFTNLITSPKAEGEATAETEIVNASVQLENESTIYYEGALENGTAVFTDEAMTEAVGNGDHTLMDGRTITVEDGKVTAIAAAETQDAEDAVDVVALQAENAELKAGLEAANTALTAANTALTAIKDLKSKYVPAAKAQDFSKAKDVDQPFDMSPEARAARAEARKKK